MHQTDTQTDPGDADRPLPGKQRPRVRVRPTRYGVLFLVVLAGLLAGAVNYANNLAYLLTFQLTGMMLVSGFVAHRCLAGIRIADIRAPSVFAGDTAIVETRLTGLPGLHYRLRMAFEDGSGSETPILGAGPATVHTAVPTRQRGRFHLGRVHLATRFL